MSDYIETRPEAIEAIKKSISHWDNVCMGCEWRTSENECALCMLNGMGCDVCSLGSNGNICTEYNSSFDNWSFASIGSEYCSIGCDTEAEAMLEALVQLLPPEHRKEYGG